MRYKYRMASVRQMALKISVTSARFGIVKLRESPPFSRRKRSALDNELSKQKAGIILYKVPQPLLAITKESA